MRAPRHVSRGTTYVPLAMDVTVPSDLLLRHPAPRHPLARWLRPLLIIGGTAAALAVLLATGAW